MYICVFGYAFCVWVGCNNTVIEDLCAHVFLALDNNKTMITLLSAHAHSIWHPHFDIWRSRINTSLSVLHVSFSLLHCWLDLFISVIVNPVQTYIIGLVGLSIHSLACPVIHSHFSSFICSSVDFERCQSWNINSVCGHELWNLQLWAVTAKQI